MSEVAPVEAKTPRPYRIYLSPPHLSGREQAYVAQAMADNWVAPAGPDLGRFEKAFSEYTGIAHTVAVASGTAALHLALRLAGVNRGDLVLCSDLTFVATGNPIFYQGATPVLLDADPATWHIDPELLEAALTDFAAKAQRPKALLAAHIYGQAAPIERLAEMCAQHGITLIEDAAESLGCTIGEDHPGSFGRMSAFSFNGNKMLTTGGGGILATDDPDLARQARHLASQARVPGPFYDHDMLGYNYRMSNILAAIGRGQLETLDARVARCRELFERYRAGLGQVEGVDFQPEPPGTVGARWLTVMTVDPKVHPNGRDRVLAHLEAQRIEARSIWRPLHQQRVFRDCPVYPNGVGDALFDAGVCLPSSTLMTDAEQDEVIALVREALGDG
ncbi:MAG: aminotransferase class I/II-fold pyridoxal phosphate-dependent enzyme [Opitutales bacterium]